MKSRTTAIIVSGLFATGLLLPALAQLPPTNMGKFVHQPGDNQYTPETQATRHGMPVQQIAPQARSPMARSQASNVPSVDVSIEPIACDEPIPVAGFPPLPDRLDLPVAGSSGSWLGNQNAGGRAGGGSASGSTGGGMTLHQHYGHVTIPGLNQNPGNGYGQGTIPNTNRGSNEGYGHASINAASGGIGYYKVKSMPIDIPNSSGGVGYYKAKTMDVYNTNSNGGGASGQPGYTGATNKDLKALGKEPQLNGGGGQVGDAPQAVPVNQSTTQDLSLPEDDFSYKYKPTSGAEKLGKSAAKGLNTLMRTLPAAAGAF